MAYIIYMLYVLLKIYLFKIQKLTWFVLPCFTFVSTVHNVKEPLHSIFSLAPQSLNRNLISVEKSNIFIFFKELSLCNTPNYFRIIFPYR